MVKCIALVSAGEKSTELGRACDFCAAMLRPAIAPNRVTYSVLVRACDKGTMPQKALQLL